VAKAKPEITGPFDNAKNKVDALRKIRSYLKGQGTADPKPAEIYEIFKATKWTKGDKDKDLNYISSSLAGLRREEGIQVAGRGKRVKAATVVPSEPTRSTMLAVKELAKAEGGLKNLAGMVDKVAELAGQVGGLDGLKANLDALRELSE
jgi:hypothetical protein